MKKKIIAFLALGILSPVLAINLDTLINATVARYENSKSFYAEFEQVYSDEGAGISRNFKGKLYFLKPNFFRMEFENPTQIYVGDSVSLWIYLPEEKRAIRQSLGEMPFAINPDMFLKNYEADYNASLTKDDSSGFEVTLQPKESTQVCQKIAVRINKKFDITGIAILDETGAESKFNFDKIEIGKKISKDLFKFNPPKGTTIDEY